VIFGNVSVIEGMFLGLKAAVLAIVLQAVLRIGKRALKNRVTDRLNHRPRKSLGFKTPYELFFKKKILLTVALQSRIRLWQRTRRAGKPNSPVRLTRQTKP